MRASNIPGAGLVVRTEYNCFLGHAVRWAVVNTHPHKERIALNCLVADGFRVYCPMLKRRRSHARRVDEVLRPLFPGYLFVVVCPDSVQWRPILGTQGVRRLVRCGGHLSLIEDEFVRTLKAREVDGVIAKPEAPFHIGQKVRMGLGAFEGIIGTIIEMQEKDRLVVLMQLLNRAVRVKIGERQISPV